MIENPIGFDEKEIEQAAQLYEDFHGEPATKETIYHAPAPGVVAQVGPLVGLIYEAIRDGEKNNYIHKFRKTSRPELAVTHDGGQLVALGGRYVFTDRGFVDV